LKNIPSLQNTPGTTATLIALYDRLGNNEKAKETMDQALENSKSSSHRVALMSSGALDDLNKRRYEAASKGFQDILKNASKLNLDEETQSIARAHYITSCVYVDSNIAMNESNNIPDFVSNESSKLSEEDLIRLEGNATGVKHENKKVRSSSLDNVEEIKLDD
jgi:tetratricopeptide (TPR) repeat protein